MAQLRRTGISRSAGIRPEARIRKGIGNMDGQNNGKSGYDDIINLPHHVSSCHPQMSMKERAAQFSPFAALTGYGEVIRETGRLTDQMLEFSEEERAELDHKLQIASSFPGGNPEIGSLILSRIRKRTEGRGLPWRGRSNGSMLMQTSCYGKRKCDKY